MSTVVATSFSTVSGTSPPEHGNQFTGLAPIQIQHYKTQDEKYLPTTTLIIRDS